MTRIALLAAVLTLSMAGGCLTPSPTPTTQPTGLTAQQMLSAIEITENGAMVAISVLHAAGSISDADYQASLKADAAFHVVDQDIAQKLVAGQQLTPTDVSNALEAVLSAVTDIHANAMKKLTQSAGK